VEQDDFPIHNNEDGDEDEDEDDVDDDDDVKSELASF
jgi:hypothetical protein